MNVWTNEDGVLITAELPGIDAQDIDISVQDGALTLRGSREPDEVEEGATYHRRERRYGRFTRVFDLPFAVEEDQVEATLNNGVLQISLPRSEADKPKKITVKAD
jgi:HSP20 family protein